VAAADEAAAVVPTGDRVDRELVPASTLRLPVRAGTEVGELVFTAGPQEVGRVAVVATRTVRAAPLVPPPWWARLVRGAAAVLIRLLAAPAI
jgi:hypothetical protein